MKNKICKFLVFIFGLLLALPVYAKENRVFIYEKDNKLYYDGEFSSENLFMKHLDILPGESFVDELTIENKTDKEFIVYFGVEESNQGNAKDLLDYISMKIELDGEVIYNGKLDGKDYNSTGINLQNKIKLKKYSKDEKSVMKVTTSLSSEYNNYNNFDKSIITWHFYADTDDINDETVPEEIEYNPKTGDNIIFFVLLLSVSVLIYLYILFVEKNYKKNTKKKKRKKD